MPSHPPSFRHERAQPASSSRGIAAIVITCALIVLIPGMVALIGYRSVMLHGPCTAVVVGGDGSLDGAKIEVSELIDPHRKWTTTLDVGNDWQAPVLLDPGPYHVNVTHRGRQILSENFAPDRVNGVRFDLPSLVWIVADASFADARVEILHSGENAHIPRVIPVKVNAEGGYRDAVYLLAGEYRAVARSAAGPDRILAQVDFTVDRTAPVRVDLAKAANEARE